MDAVTISGPFEVRFWVNVKGSTVSLTCAWVTFSAIWNAWMLLGASIAYPIVPASDRSGCMRTNSVNNALNVLLLVELAEKKMAVSGTDGWVRYVTEVTMPYVPPPPPRSAQNKLGLVCEFAVSLLRKSRCQTR